MITSIHEAGVTLETNTPWKKNLGENINIHRKFFSKGHWTHGGEVQRCRSKTCFLEKRSWYHLENISISRGGTNTSILNDQVVILLLVSEVFVISNTK